MKSSPALGLAGKEGAVEMTKNELIQYLRAFLQAENRCYEIQSEITRLKNTISNLKKEPTLEERQGLGESLVLFLLSTIMGGIALGVLLIISIFIVTLFDNNGKGPFGQFIRASATFLHLENHPILFCILFPLLISAILSLLLTVYIATDHNKHYQQRNQQKIEEYKKVCAQIPALEANLNKQISELKLADYAFEILKQRNIVHPQWHDKIRYLLEYLEQGRADTLKEALNLWEQESAQRRMAAENRRFHQQMSQQMAAHAAAMEEQAERTADASERAADSADEAAMWGALTAYETVKINQKLKK